MGSEFISKYSVIDSLLIIRDRRKGLSQRGCQFNQDATTTSRLLRLRYRRRIALPCCREPLLFTPLLVPLTDPSFILLSSSFLSMRMPSSIPPY